MTIFVRMFAVCRDLANASTLAVELPEPANIADLRHELDTACPALQSILPRCAFAVCDEWATDETRIEEGATIALVPPVSGG